MRQVTFSFFLLIILLSLAGTAQGQKTFAAGGTSDSNGQLTITIGQVVYMDQADTSLRIAQGVQRAIGSFLVGDTTACSKDSLGAMLVAATGGDWTVESEIGTTIDTIGSLKFGDNPSSTAVFDTVYYAFNGYVNFVRVGVKKGVTLSCQDLSLITDGLGKVYLDSQAVKTMSKGILSGEDLYSLTDTVLSCEAGFKQNVTLNSQDSSGCAGSCSISVTLVDTIQPVTGCPATEELVLLWIGTTLTPASFQGSSTDNCGASGLEYSFSADFDQPSLTLSCREQLLLLDTVMVYIRDESDNISSCTISLSYNEEAGEDCSCDWGALKLKGEIAPNDYKARESILASGRITLGDTVSMKAGEIIVFSPGFQVSKGSSLFARIDSCGNYQPSVNIPTANLNENNEGNISFQGAEDDGVILTEIRNILAFPNPFQAWFKIGFTLDQPGAVNIELYNVQGGKVYGLLRNAVYESGAHEIMIDGSRISEGMYFLRLEKDGVAYSLPLVKGE